MHTKKQSKRIHNKHEGDVNMKREYKIGTINVMNEDALSITGVGAPQHHYIAVAEGNTITFHVGQGTESDIMKRNGISPEKLVGAGRLYTDRQGKLCIDGTSIKYDTIPADVAGTLAQLVKGELDVRGIKLPEAYATVDDRTSIHPYWTPNTEETMALTIAPEMFNRSTLAKIGTTEQAMIKLLRDTGLPATRETIEDLEYLMGEKHLDRGIKPAEVKSIVLAGYHTTDEISKLLELEDDLAGQTSEFDCIAENRAIETARASGDIMNVESLEQVRDFRRYSMKEASEYFVELDFDTLGGELLDDLDRELEGNQGIAHKLTKLVEIAREGGLTHLEQAKNAYQEWYKTSQTKEEAETGETVETDLLDKEARKLVEDLKDDEERVSSVETMRQEELAQEKDTE